MYLYTRIKGGETIERYSITLYFNGKEKPLYDDLYETAHVQGLHVSTMIKRFCQFFHEKNFMLGGKYILVDRETFEQFFGEPHTYKPSEGSK